MSIALLSQEVAGLAFVELFNLLTPVLNDQARKFKRRQVKVKKTAGSKGKCKKNSKKV